MEQKILQKQNNSKLLLKQLEKEVAESEVRACLFLAMERLEMTLSNTYTATNDIVSEFYYLKLSEVKEALRLGSLGKYGRTFKLNTQEVCFWIRQFILERDKNKSL